MKDWIGFNKDAGSEVMSKVGQWNLAVAVKALAESVEQYLHEQERKSKELPPISPGVHYEVVLHNGMKCIGAVADRGSTWTVMHDLNDKSIIIRTTEVACFVEQSKGV